MTSRVPHAVHMTDLIAVVGRNRYLDDALPRLVQLDDDLGIEVEAVGIDAKGMSRSAATLYAIPGVPLTKSMPTIAFCALVRIRLPTYL